MNGDNRDRVVEHDPLLEAVSRAVLSITHSDIDNAEICSGFQRDDVSFGMQLRVIDEDAVRAWKATGRFSTDDERHEELSRLLSVVLQIRSFQCQPVAMEPTYHMTLFVSVDELYNKHATAFREAVDFLTAVSGRSLVCARSGSNGERFILRMQTYTRAEADALSVASRVFLEAMGYFVTGE